PREPGAVPEFVGHLEPSKASRLDALLRKGKGNPIFDEFLKRLGAPRPSDQTLADLRHALEAGAEDSPAPLAGDAPADPDQGWIRFFSNRAISLLRSDEAAALLEKFRDLAAATRSHPQDSPKRAAFYWKLATWAGSLTGPQRAKAAELLNAV